MGWAALAGFEGLCVVCGWGRPALYDDPFVGFRELRPLFVLSQDGSSYEIPKSRQKHFCAESFLAQKPLDEYRIFCLGDSTVQGNPYLTETSFTTWLKLSLQAADASRRWKVVNCGGISYASYRLTPILKEILRYEPDLVVLYTGHNEFLEDRRFEHIRDRGAVLNASIAAAARLRTFNLLRAGYACLRGATSSAPQQGRPLLPAEVEALLDYRGGLEEYRRNEAWRQNVIRQFRFHLDRMAQLARQAGVPLVFVNPACNVGDMPPFKAEHRADLDAEELARWEALFAAARGHFRRGSYNLHAAIAELEQACQIDPLHAGGWFTLAECYRSTGRVQEAREAYLRAKEFDVCPLRILEPMNEAVLDAAQKSRSPLVDVRALFERHSEHGIVGADQMVDHVHPTIEGHQRIADALADKLVELAIVRPAADWQQQKQQLYQQQLDSLDDHYYLLGEQRLKSLRLWARGRAETVRPEAIK